MAESDSDALVIIEDSEPECEDALFSIEPSPQLPVAPAPSTSSHHFPATPATARVPPRRRRKPWEATSLAAPPPALSRKLSLPAPPPSASSAQPKLQAAAASLPLPLVRSTSISSSSGLSSSSGFQSASSLLRHRLRLSDDEDSSSASEERRPAKKGKRKETVAVVDVEISSEEEDVAIRTTGRTATKIARAASVKKRKPATRQVAGNSGSFTDDDVDATPASTTPAPSDSSSDDGDDVEIVELASDAEVDQLASSSADEQTAAERLRAGLSHFRHTATVLTRPSVPRPRAVLSHVPPAKPRDSKTGRSTTAAPPFLGGNPISLPPTPRISVLPSCPLCSVPFAATKTTASKSAHLLSCAHAKDYTAQTVRILVENLVLSLASTREMDRRKAESERTLFERIVGVGEGRGKGEVKVVGVVVGRVGDVQSEFDERRKKAPVEKVVRLALEIRTERGGDPARTTNATATRTEEAIDERPRATGLLKGDVAHSRVTAARRAEGLLRDLGGTGLTQLPSVSSPLIPVITLDASSEEEGEDEDEDDFAAPPPATQPFPPSKLATRLASAGQVQVVTIHPKAASPPPPRNGDVRKSLWVASIGTDDELIRRRVVLSALSRNN